MEALVKFYLFNIFSDSLLTKATFLIMILVITSGVVSVLVRTSGVCCLEWRRWLELGPLGSRRLRRH